MSIAGHVSRAMLSRYSHIRMEAKQVLISPSPVQTGSGSGFGHLLNANAAESVEAPEQDDIEPALGGSGPGERSAWAGFRCAGNFPPRPTSRCRALTRFERPRFPRLQHGRIMHLQQWLRSCFSEGCSELLEIGGGECSQSQSESIRSRYR